MTFQACIKQLGLVLALTPLVVSAAQLRPLEPSCSTTLMSYSKVVTAMWAKTTVTVYTGRLQGKSPVQGDQLLPPNGDMPPAAGGYLLPSFTSYLAPPTTYTSSSSASRTQVLDNMEPQAVTVANIVTAPCRCGFCSYVVQENPCICTEVFGCGEDP